MRHRCSWTRLWLLLVLVVPVRADREADALRQNNNNTLRQQRQQRALMVRDRTFVIDSARTADILLFCRQKGVDTLVVSSNNLPSAGLFSSREQYAWRDLLGRAHRQGMTVIAAVGNAGWVYDLGAALRQVDAVAALSRQGAPGEAFDGVLLDYPMLAQLERLYPPPSRLVPASEEDILDGLRQRPQTGGEELTLPGGEEGADEAASDRADQRHPGEGEYQEETSPALALQDRDLLRQYLDHFERVTRYVRRRYESSRLRVGITVPAWLRVPMGWNGEIKPAGNHFVDLADFVVAHNFPGQTVDVGRAADAVLTYAGETGKQVFLRFDLGRSSRAVPELVTLQGRDELFLEAVLNATLERDADVPGFAGFVLDDYHSYRLLPDRREPAGRDGANSSGRSVSERRR